MNEKKEKILQVALKLFSEKGYHETSMQEVADRSGVSKGAVYLHFSSKDDLIVSIYKYYFKRLREQVLSAGVESHLSSEENFIQQLQTYFHETLKYKDFIKMQYREQIRSFNDDIKAIIVSMFKDTKKWYERHLLKIYGEEIRIYISDVIIMMNGMIQSYMRTIFSNQVELDIDRLARFIFERTDDLVKTMITQNVKPMVTRDQINQIFSDGDKDTLPLHIQIQKELESMVEKLKQISLPEDERFSIQETLNFLFDELKKEDLKVFIFKGMLGNLINYEAFTPHCINISQLLHFEIKPGTSKT